MDRAPREEWQPRAAAHAQRVDVWVQPHLDRRRRGIDHPVHDFLFTYYSHRPAALRRWHPGYGVTLLDAPEYDGLRGYEVSAVLDHRGGRAATERRSVETSVTHGWRADVRSSSPLGPARRDGVATGHAGLLRAARVGDGLPQPTSVRHPWPLRLGAAGTEEVVEAHRIGCSHFDAFRFFTDAARPLNTLQPGRRRPP